MNVKYVTKRPESTLGGRRTRSLARHGVAVRYAYNASDPGVPSQKTQRSACLILPGFLSSYRQYEQMAQNLRQLGHPEVQVAPIRTRDWFPTLAGASFGFYLRAADPLLVELYQRWGRISLVGHSAGGWLARLLLGSEPYDGYTYGRAHMVHTLVSLGTPHLSLEQYPFGRIPERWNAELGALETRGSSLRFCNYHYPTGESFPGVRIVCIAGEAVHGKALNVSALYRLDGPLWNGADRQRALSQNAAYVAYKAACGCGEVSGDGVCPTQCSLLPNAEHKVMQGVFHSPAQGHPWFGDAVCVQEWDSFLP